MRFRWVKWIFFLLLSTKGLLAQNLPDPQRPARLVNDFAGVLNRMEVNQLESMLVAYNDSTSTQITIVTIQSLDGFEIADYANRLYEKWGIGQKGTNNGLLILVAVNDREVRMEVGYGLEERITDALARRIIEQDILPQFRSGNYAGGLAAASKRIMQLLSGAFTADERIESTGGKAGILLILLLLVIIIAVNSRNGGGSNYTGRGRAGYQPPFFFPMGGGGFGGGGFSGGGFGGFGGGLSGGGGASGRW
jgi:uncharacterized protein